ncbi:MAG: PorP/SprF family type IX secretion system membrane protein [Flavobacteriales bacterium]
MKNNFSKIAFIFSLVSSLFTSSLNAQSDPSFRRNQFSALLVNPAQAGANAYDNVSLLASKSYVGFTGAPKTIAGVGNFRLFKNFGLGVSAFNDQLGPINTTRASVDFAYHLKLSSKWKMSLGLRGSASSINIDLPSLTTTQLQDPHMQSVLSSGTNFDAGWGLLVYSKNLYFGLSQPRLMNTKFINANVTDYVEGKSFVSYLGGDFNLNKLWSIRPVAMVRYVKALPTLIDISTTFTYKEMLDLGLNYQYGSNVGVIVGHEVNKKLYIGYNYTYPISSLNRISSQSHEVVIRLKLNSNSSSKFQGPRFFN